jgi:hypothetical protein
VRPVRLVRRRVPPGPPCLQAFASRRGQWHPVRRPESSLGCKWSLVQIQSPRLRPRRFGGFPEWRGLFATAICLPACNWTPVVVRNPTRATPRVPAGFPGSDLPIGHLRETAAPPAHRLQAGLITPRAAPRHPPLTPARPCRSGQCGARARRRPRSDPSARAPHREPRTAPARPRTPRPRPRRARLGDRARVMTGPSTSPLTHTGVPKGALPQSRLREWITARRPRRHRRRRPVRALPPARWRRPSEP